MKKTKVSWCVVDAKAQVIRCDRCMEAYPLSGVYGQPVDIFLAISSAFIKLHKGCKEKTPLTRPLQQASLPLQLEENKK